MVISISEEHVSSLCRVEVHQVGEVVGCIEVVRKEMGHRVKEWPVRDGLGRQAADELVETIDPEKDTLQGRVSK
jgi:hypothetical protein